MEGEYIYGKIKKSRSGVYKVTIETPNERYALKLIEILSSIASLDYSDSYVREDERQLKAFIVTKPNQKKDD